jgi:hypothetical protein
VHANPGYGHACSFVEVTIKLIFRFFRFTLYRFVWFHHDVDPTTGVAVSPDHTAAMIAERFAAREWDVPDPDVCAARAVVDRDAVAAADPRG